MANKELQKLSKSITSMPKGAKNPAFKAFMERQINNGKKFGEAMKLWKAYSSSANGGGQTFITSARPKAKPKANAKAKPKAKVKAKAKTIQPRQAKTAKKLIAKNARQAEAKIARKAKAAEAKVAKKALAANKMIVKNARLAEKRIAKTAKKARAAGKAKKSVPSVAVSKRPAAKKAVKRPAARKAKKKPAARKRFSARRNFARAKKPVDVPTVQAQAALPQKEASSQPVTVAAPNILGEANSSDEMVALEMAKFYIKEVAPRRLRREITLENSINAYFFALQKVREKKGEIVFPPN